VLKQISVIPIDLGSSSVTAAYAAVLGEAAAVCLDHNCHDSGVLLTVNGVADKTFALNWEELVDAHYATYADLQDATELGAYGVALLIIRDVTGKTTIERSAKGGGFDWWIGDSASEMPFQGKCRLEVSGILTDRGGAVESRLSQKKRQTNPSDALGPAIIAVVDFGSPRAQVEEK
jgi:hypothetical protein